MLTRRSCFQISAALLVPRFAAAKSEFWNAKAPDKWSAEEIEKLTTDSPWAKGVNVEFQQDTDPAFTSANSPSIGRAGAIEAPRNPAHTVQMGPDAEPVRGGSRRREPVIVRWESGQAIRDAYGFPLPAEFKDRYVIGVTRLPYGIMEKPKRGGAAPVEAESAIQRQQKMRELLQSAAYLEARDKEPAQAGIVRLAPKATQTWLFGFSKEFLNIEPTDREVQFTLHTAMVSLRAKFEPKAMLYRGKLSV
jgi:hypothetical protein